MSSIISILDNGNSLTVNSVRVISTLNSAIDVFFISKRNIAILCLLELLVFDVWAVHSVSVCTSAKGQFELRVPKSSVNEFTVHELAPTQLRVSSTI